MGGGKVRKRPSNEDHQNDTCELLTPPEKSIFTLLNILFVFFATDIIFGQKKSGVLAPGPGRMHKALLM